MNSSLNELQKTIEQTIRSCAPNNLDEIFDFLHLPVSLKNYKSVLDTAGKENLSHQEFLLRLLSLESCAKFERQIQARITQAKFPQIKTLDTFDFNFPASIPKQKILAVTQLAFIDNAEGIVFIGPTGVGKTHLANAIGHKAASAGIKTLYTRAVDMINYLIASQADHSLHRAMKYYCSPRLLVIDEVGYLPFDKQGSDHFFNVISSRYEKGSVVLTTNRPFKDWGKIFHDNTVASAIIDRLVHHSEVIKIEGASYRVNDRKRKDNLVIPQ
jgi:DNA replication protein DnaC